MAIQVIDHPLAGHILTQLRNKSTPPSQFRAHCRTLTTLLALEATKKILVVETEIETPVKRTIGTMLSQPIAAVPILRAGLGMLEAIVDLFPDVSVGYIGLERDHKTAVARTYYEKVPKIDRHLTLLLDPMLATGGSAIKAVNLLKASGAKNIIMVSIVSAPEGIKELLKCHPDTAIVTAAIDEGLNDLRYIVPGLGDFGDRLYGTF